MGGCYAQPRGLAHDTRDARVLPLREIAERVGCSERTVRRALKRGRPPPRRPSGVRTSKLDPYKTQVDQLLAEGLWNATVILAEIKAGNQRGQIKGVRVIWLFVTQR